jgi:hypothetical protein
LLFASSKEEIRIAKKFIYFVSILSVTLAFIGGISVVGLLQSTERVGSSGIVIEPPPPPASPPPSPPSSPPPEPSIEIDVYSDSACTQTVSSVDWGEIEAGGAAYNTIYVKNSGDEGVTLSFTTENWSPADASTILQLSWNYDGSTIASGEVREILFTLSVSSSASAMDSFGFDIVIVGSAL